MKKGVAVCQKIRECVAILDIAQEFNLAIRVLLRRLLERRALNSIPNHKQAKVLRLGSKALHGLQQQWKILLWCEPSDIDQQMAAAGFLELKK